MERVGYICEYMCIQRKAFGHLWPTLARRLSLFFGTLWCFVLVLVPPKGRASNRTGSGSGCFLTWCFTCGGECRQFPHLKTEMEPKALLKWPRDNNSSCCNPWHNNSCKCSSKSNRNNRKARNILCFNYLIRKAGTCRLVSCYGVMLPLCGRGFVTKREQSDHLNVPRDLWMSCRCPVRSGASCSDVNRAICMRYVTGIYP